MNIRPEEEEVYTPKRRSDNHCFCSNQHLMCCSSSYQYLCQKQQFKKQSVKTNKLYKQQLLQKSAFKYKD